MQEKKNLPTDPYGDLDVEMLKRFSEANGICGHEKGASRVMAEYLKDAADTIDYDNLGSIIGCKKGKGEGPSVALFGQLSPAPWHARRGAGQGQGAGGPVH